MKKEDLCFLRKLMKTISPSGYEEDASKMWRKEAVDCGMFVRTDEMGNSMAQNTKNLVPPPSIMLAGHIDEIGLMITYINDDGFLYFSTIGGWDDQVLPGQHVEIKTKDGILPGVIGKNPIHLIEAKERKNAVKTTDLWIDIGALDKTQATSLVDIGDCAVVHRSFRRLKGDNVACRGFDDKIGAFVVLQVLKRLSGSATKNPRVCAVATTQEEVGLRGGRTSAFSVNPDVGIAVDVTFTTDTPTTKPKKNVLGEISLGKGPVVTRGVNITPWLFNLIIETAKKEHIPHQVCADSRPTGTDANAMQMSRGGMATALISVPNRYMHSPCEIVNLDDVDNTIELLAKVAIKITPEMIKGY
ncbi:MAG: M42 family metallopeptidase [Candidatus Marinimicrobia bacterium]|nr:M42 family metallopeptidase [Candidatus Neomarinimicrobiota bacterium]